MADEKKTSMLLIIVVVGVVLFLLLRKPAPATRPTVIVQPQPTTAQTLGNVAVTAAPALGSFLGSLFGGSSSSSSSSNGSSSSFSDDGLLTPSYAGDTSSAFSDDTFDDLV